MKIAIDTNHNVIPKPEPPIACGKALKEIVHPEFAGPDSANNDEIIIKLDKKNNQ
jgi:hypothetical protein